MAKSERTSNPEFPEIYFYAERLKAHFHKLSEKIVYRLDKRSKNVLNVRRQRGEFRHLFSHTFNREFGQMKDYGEMYVNHGHVFWLYCFAKSLHDFGEMYKIGYFMDAPRKDWNVVNRTIGLRYTLENFDLDLADPIGGDETIEYDRKELAKEAGIQ